jgi:hypothetical protein
LIAELKTAVTEFKSTYKVSGQTPAGGGAPPRAGDAGKVAAGEPKGTDK